jgi:hypothetical protein
MKQKILEGEIFDEDTHTPAQSTEVHSMSVTVNRVSKSIAGVRTAKNGQHLRKIAEGLGDLNLLRVN